VRKRLDFAELALLEEKYGLSLQAWIYRARDLGISGDAHLRTLFAALGARGGRRREPVEVAGEESSTRWRRRAIRALAEGVVSREEAERIVPGVLAGIEGLGGAGSISSGLGRCRCGLGGQVDRVDGAPDDLHPRRAVRLGACSSRLPRTRGSRGRSVWRFGARLSCQRHYADRPVARSRDPHLGAGGGTSPLTLWRSDVGMNRAPDEPTGEIAVYETPDGEVRVDVRLDRETVWLSISRIAELFERDKSVIAKHLRKIYATGELDRTATVAKNASVQHEGGREVTRELEHFNLDAILSVGYRVNSRRGTKFRIWANRVLREHLLRGFTLEERRLRARGLGEVEQAVDLLARTLTARSLVTDEGRAVLEVVQRYTRAWRLLLEYDEERLAPSPARPLPATARLGIDDVRAAVRSLRGEIAGRGEAGPLFGQERGEALSGILGAIEQTFGGQPLYPNAQLRAAHLLYFVIKDHPFSDGNKRIGTLLFLEYLRRCGLLMRPDGSPRLADNAMVALTLLIAESDAEQKDLLIRLVLNLLEEDAIGARA